MRQRALGPAGEQPGRYADRMMRPRVGVAGPVHAHGELHCARCGRPIALADGRFVHVGEPGIGHAARPGDRPTTGGDPS